VEWVMTDGGMMMMTDEIDDEPMMMMMICTIDLRDIIKVCLVPVVKVPSLYPGSKDDDV